MAAGTPESHRGSSNPNASLTERLVREVVRLHGLGFGYQRIADHLDVSKSCVQKVLTGRTWRHVTRKRRPVVSKRMRRLFPGRPPGRD